MIKKINKDSDAEIMDFLKVEASLNLFIISNIERFGYEEILDVYGDYDENILIGIMTRFQNNYTIYYSTLSFDINGFYQVFKKNLNKIMLSGRESIILRYKNCIEKMTKQTTFFCELKSKEYLKENHLNIKVATMGDAPRIYNFMADIDELNGPGNNVEFIKKRIELSLGRIYYVEDDYGELETIAQTTSESSNGAMIIGVATKVDSRGKGLLTQCLSQLCSDLIDEGKILCLFYDNPDAGIIYRRIGFKPIDKWMMLCEE